MLNTKKALLAIMTLCLAATPALADTAVRTLDANAIVSAKLDFSLRVIQHDLTANILSYDFGRLGFGELVSVDGNTPMHASYYFDVEMSANTSRRPYQITQTAAPLSNGTVDLPSGACIVTPWSTDANGNALPAGSSVDTNHKSFIQSDMVLYNSGPEGRIAAPVATYAITSEANAGATEIIPVDMPYGSYDSTVVFTLATL